MFEDKFITIINYYSEPTKVFQAEKPFLLQIQRFSLYKQVVES